MGVYATSFIIKAKPQNADMDLSALNLTAMDVFGHDESLTEPPGLIEIDAQGNMTAHGAPFVVGGKAFAVPFEILGDIDFTLRVCIEARGSLAKVWVIHQWRDGEFCEFDLPEHIRAETD